MKNLIINQKLLFDDSEKLLFNLFDNEFTEKEILINNKTSSLKIIKKTFTEKLENLELNNIDKLIKIIAKIEENASKKYAIKYFEGYLEYKNILLDEMFQESEKYNCVV